MRFLILGVTGMAGHVMALYLSERGHDVTGLARHSTGIVPSIACDATDFARLKDVVREGGYDVVVNAVGILNQEAEERKAVAVALNALLPHELARMTADLPTRVFHISTDCVFAGNTGPYDERSVPDGQTFYDRSKALGELRDAKNLTMRTSIVGPDMNEHGIGLLNWFMRQSGEVNGFTGALWTGLTSLELARAMEAAAASDVTGLVNMVPEGNISKYELLGLFNEHIRAHKVTLAASDGFQCDKSLVRTNHDLDFRAGGYSQQVQELAAWMRAHRGLYPHYDIQEDNERSGA